MRIKNLDELSKLKINKNIAKTIKEKLISGEEKVNKNKYKNVETVRIINKKEVKFDSAKEAKYYDELFLKLKTGLISDLKTQPEYEIIPKIRYKNITLRKIIYIADFSFIENGILTVVDVKGFKTDVYQIKKRLFLLHNPNVNFLEV